MKKTFWGRKVAGIVAMVAIGIVAFGYIVMMLWNNVLVATLPGVHAVTFGQALGLLVLSKILFGSFRGGGGWRGRGGPWGGRMKEKWAGMSDEEKENFKNEWKNRCSKWEKRKDDEAVNS